MQENENILRILKETLEAINSEDSFKIKQLSDQTINTASMTQDVDNVSVAVIVYSLGKIMERERYQKYPEWDKFLKFIKDYLKDSINYLKEKDEERTRNSLENIRRIIGKLSGKLRKYIKEVFRRAQISKASRIYEHGISMERTAKLLGITSYELAEYAGQTGISDVANSKTMSVKERINLIKEFFK